VNPFLSSYVSDSDFVTTTFAGHEVTLNGYVIPMYRLVIRDDGLES